MADLRLARRPETLITVYARMFLRVEALEPCFEALILLGTRSKYSQYSVLETDVRWKT